MRNRISLPLKGGSARPFLAILLAAVPVTFIGCAKSGPKKTSYRSVPTNYVEGSFVVSANGGTDEAALKGASETVATELGCRMASFDQINWGSAETTGVLSEEMKNTFNVRFENCDFSKDGTEAILQKFEAQTGISGVESEALAAATPIRENDQYKGRQDHLTLIKRDQACNASERNNKKPVIVAVIDSGIDMDHPDLVDMFYKDKNGRVIGANFVGAGSSMAPDDNWDDQAGHGTHVAGLIGAMSNNAKGVVGVGSCTNIKIMPVRVLNDKGSGTSIEIDRGVKWAADHGAQIINMSLGFTSITYQANPSQYRSLFADLAKRDVIVFAAAGNDGYENGSEADGGYRFHYPSSYQNVISVAATDNDGQLTSFSNRGKDVDIAAPGYQVLSTTMDGRYGRMSGTSMATPVAAGTYALALASAEEAFAENIDRIDSKIVNQLLASSVLSSYRLSERSVSAGGVIDAEKLVKATMAKFPEAVDEPLDTPVTPTEDDQVAQPAQPEPQPAQPVVEPVQPKEFEFAGLSSGQKLKGSLALEVQNLPTGTVAVYFYWGDSYWSFTKAYVQSGATSVKDADEWYLYGNRTLTAVAYNKYGRSLKVAKISLKGL